jgi:hypothetical protein
MTDTENITFVFNSEQAAVERGWELGSANVKYDVRNLLTDYQSGAININHLLRALKEVSA